MGRLLIVAGIVLVILGAWLTWGPRIPFLHHLGHLPGDVRIERPGLRLYLPITTCVLLSVILTVVLRLLGRK